MFITKSSEAYINPVLTKLLVYYKQYGFVGDKLAPIVDVGEEAENGTFFKFDGTVTGKSNLQSTLEFQRAYGAKAATVNWDLTTDTYSCIEYSAEKAIDWREFKQWKGREFDLAAVTQRIIMDLLLLSYEIRIATKFTTTSNYPSSSYYTSLSGTQCWDDHVNSDPEGVIETAREQVSLYGDEANTIAVPVNVWRTIRRHPAIRALVNDTDSSQLTEDGFPKKIFGLNAVYPGARRNTAQIGATETLARIWSDNVWVGVVSPTPSKMDISFAYTFAAQGMKTETYEDKSRKSDVVRVQHGIYDEKIVASNCGYLIQNTLT